MFSYLLTGVVGAAVGAGVMWYYWRRYKTTDAFKNKVDETVGKIKQSAQDLKDKANDLVDKNK